ncbi:MAG TPA: universal stress protein [Gemmatimonadales bacterium]|nr:universal stress protein [Gemmatimonadales bacterium]
MYRAILVPLDGSPFAEQALAVAADIAVRAGATLHLVLVHQGSAVVSGPGEPVVIDPGIDERLRGEERGYLGHVHARVAPGGELRLVETVLEGPVAESIAHYAHDHAVDLVVMTTHGRGSFSRFWLGSVADRLVRMLEQPLLLLRPQASRGTPAPEAVKRIVLPLDGSPHAEAMIEPAVLLAQVFDAELTLSRIVERLAPIWLPTPGVVPVPDTDAMPHRQLEATRYLHEVANRLRVRGLRVATAVEVAADPVSGIMELCERERMDVIALATHGHGGPMRFLLGSVADKLVRSATVPLLVWRPRLKEKAAEPAIALGEVRMGGVW